MLEPRRSRPLPKRLDKLRSITRFFTSRSQTTLRRRHSSRPQAFHPIGRSPRLSAQYCRDRLGFSRVRQTASLAETSPRIDAKNRKDVPASYNAVTFSAHSGLTYPDASTNRKDWTVTQLAEIEPFKGVTASVVLLVSASIFGIRWPTPLEHQDGDEVQVPCSWMQCRRRICRIWC